MPYPAARWQSLGRLIRVGVVCLGLAPVTPAFAGGVDVSIGIGVPAPVVVAPAPVFVAPPPVIVQPAPVLVSPPAVVVQEPPVGSGRPLPPGLAKKYYGYSQGRHGHKHHHKHHGWHADD